MRLPLYQVDAFTSAVFAGNPAAVGLPKQMYLFGPEGVSGPGPIEKELESVDVDALSPREAQAMLYELKRLSQESPT